MPGCGWGISCSLRLSIDLKARPAYDGRVSYSVLILYVILLTSSGAGVLALGFLHYRLRARLTASFLGANGLLLIALILQTVMVLTELSGGYVISFLLGVGIYGCVTWALCSLPSSPRRLLLGAFVAVTGLMGGQLYLLLAGNPAASALRMPVMLGISVYLLILGGVMIRTAPEAPEAPGRVLVWLMKALGLLTVIFAPLSAALYFLLSLVPFFSRLDFSLDFVYYFGWNLVSAAALIRYFFSPQAVEMETVIDDDLAARYRLTPREREVVQMIGRGLSNRKIAEEMYVSFPTVRTHVYNIFRKCGVKSRMELLAAVSRRRGFVGGEPPAAEEE